MQVKTLLKTSQDASSDMISCKEIEGCSDDSSSFNQDTVPGVVVDDGENAFSNNNNSQRTLVEPIYTAPSMRKTRFAAQHLAPKASMESFKSAVAHQNESYNSSDDHLPSFDNTYALVVHVTSMVRQLAEEVVSEPEPVTDWSWIPQEDAPKVQVPLRTHTVDVEDTIHSSPAAQRDFTIPVKEDFKPKSYNVHSFSDQQPSPSERTSPIHKTGIVSPNQEDQFARLEERLLSIFPNMVQESFLNKLAEVEQARQRAEDEAAKLRPSSEEPKEPIRFKDAVGRKFLFPWKLAKMWTVSIVFPFLLDNAREFQLTRSNVL